VQRHAHTFLELAEEATPHLASSAREPWLRRLEADYENLRVALPWLLEHSGGRRACRLNGALGWFWYFQGRVGEGRHWLERALDSGDVGAVSSERASALRCARRLLLGLPNAITPVNDAEGSARRAWCAMTADVPGSEGGAQCDLPAPPAAPGASRGLRVASVPAGDHPVPASRDIGAILAAGPRRPAARARRGPGAVGHRREPRAVYRVPTVNLETASAETRRGARAQWGALLNELPHPIQVLMRSQPATAHPVIDRIKAHGRRRPMTPGILAGRAPARRPARRARALPGRAS
jgi:hypothetical protein